MATGRGKFRMTFGPLRRLPETDIELDCYRSATGPKTPKPQTGLSMV